MTDRSSSVAHFDEQTAAIPETISGAAAVEGEVIPPGQTGDEETGWPIFDVQQIFALPFFFLSRRYGELWRLDHDEEAALARAWKPILDRYLPLEETALGTALLVSLAVIGPRALQTDWEKAKKKTAGAAQPNSTPRASTKTAASGESVSTSENGKAENHPAWAAFSDQ